MYAVLSRGFLYFHKKLFESLENPFFLIENTVGICRLNKNQLFRKNVFTVLGAHQNRISLNIFWFLMPDFNRKLMFSNFLKGRNLNA